MPFVKNLENSLLEEISSRPYCSVNISHSIAFFFLRRFCLDQDMFHV